MEQITASGGEPKSLRPAILRYYLNLMARDPAVAEAVSLGSTNPIATGKADRRLSIKMLRHHWELAWIPAKAAGIVNKWQLLRGVAALAAEDFQISTRDGVIATTPKSSNASKVS